jgi:hypothetical protein
MIRKTISDLSIKQFAHLTGDFRPPSFRVRFEQVVGTLMIIVGGLIIRSLFDHRHDLSPSVRLFLVVPMSCALLPIGYLWLKRAGRWYHFASGRVQFRSNTGKVIWDEDLSTVVSANISYGEGAKGFLNLSWNHIERKIEVYADLADALKGLESAKDAVASR